MQQIKIGMVVDTFYRYEIIGVVIFGFSLKSEVITVTFQHDQLKSGKKNLLD